MGIHGTTTKRIKKKKKLPEMGNGDRRGSTLNLIALTSLVCSTLYKFSWHWINQSHTIKFHPSHLFQWKKSSTQLFFYYLLTHVHFFHTMILFCCRYRVIWFVRRCEKLRLWRRARPLVNTTWITSTIGAIEEQKIIEKELEIKFRNHILSHCFF